MKFRLFYTGKTAVGFDPEKAAKILSVLGGREFSMAEVLKGDEMPILEGLPPKKADQLASRLHDEYGLVCRTEPIVDELEWELAPIEEKERERFVCPACGHEEDFEDEDDTQETHICSKCGKVAGKVLKNSERERIRAQIKASREAREARLKKELEEQKLLEERERIRKEIEAGEPQLLKVEGERKGFPVAGAAAFLLAIAGAGYGIWHFLSKPGDPQGNLAFSQAGYEKESTRPVRWSEEGGSSTTGGPRSPGEAMPRKGSSLIPDSILVTNRIDMPTVVEMASQVARENEGLPAQAERKEIPMNYRPAPGERLGPVVVAERVTGNRRDAERMVDLVGLSPELVQSAGRAALEEKSGGKERDFLEGTDLARRMAQEMEDAVGRVVALAGLGRDYALAGQEEEASRLFAEAGEAALSLDSELQKAIALASLAVQEHKAGHESSAARHIDRARQSAEALAKAEDRFEALSRVGWALASMGREVDASELFERILGQAGAGGLPPAIADSALRSVALAQLESGDIRSAADTLARIGDSSVKDGVILELLESEEAYRQLDNNRVDALLDDLGNIETRIRGLALYAVHKALLGRKRESNRLFQRARDLAERIPTIDSQVRAQTFLAHQLIYAGNRSEGARLFDELVAQTEKGVYRELDDATLAKLARSLAEAGLHKDSQRIALRIRDEGMRESLRKLSLNLIAVNAILERFSNDPVMSGERQSNR